MKAMREVKGVELYCGDQCCFGQAAKGPDGIVGLARKRTGWLTNSVCVGLALQVRCQVDRGDNTLPALEHHKHVWLVSGRARATERYPPKLVAAVLKAMRAQLQQDRNVSMNALEAGIGPHIDEPELLPDVGGWAQETDDSGGGVEAWLDENEELPRAYDEYIGNLLDGALATKREPTKLQD